MVLYPNRILRRFYFFASLLSFTSFAVSGAGRSNGGKKEEIKVVCHALSDKEIKIEAMLGEKNVIEPQKIIEAVLPDFLYEKLPTDRSSKQKVLGYFDISDQNIVSNSEDTSGYYYFECKNHKVENKKIPDVHIWLRFTHDSQEASEDMKLATFIKNYNLPGLPSNAYQKKLWIGGISVTVLVAAALGGYLLFRSKSVQTKAKKEGKKSPEEGTE